MAPARAALRLALVAVFALMLLAVPAFGTDADKAAAKAHFEAATRLYDVHEYAKAVDEYKAAYLAKPDPAFLFNVGQCYRKLGKLDKALEFYQEYLKKAPPDDPNRANVEARIRNTDTGDVFDGEAPQKTTTQLVPPAPPGATRVAEPALGAEVATPAPVAAPAAWVDLPPQVPPPLATAEPSFGNPAALDLTAAQSPAPAANSAPVYKTWWFWTGVGAAVVAGTVAAIVIASGGNGGPTATTALGTQAVFQ